mmetsp:Transcript_11498/g.23557  ORF Transcript_11498/g.23557 Transcript_11498/m.23557 type:complete len:384 (+) Transcript_11498:78-1229(+)
MFISHTVLIHHGLVSLLARCQRLDLDSSIDLGAVLHEVNDTSRVSVLVVVPGDELDKAIVEHDSGTSIEDGGPEVGLEVGGDEGLVGESKDALHVASLRGLDGGADLVVVGGLGELAGKVDDGDVNGRDTEGHSGELSLKGRDDLGDGLGGSSGGGDDVAGGGTSTTPVLLGGGVDDSLGGGHGVDGGHEGLIDSEGIIDALDHRGKSVGGAGSAGDEVLGSVVLVLVDAHDDGLGIVLGGGGVDDLLGATVKDALGLFLGEEDSGGLADVVSTELSPSSLGRVPAPGGGDLLAVDDKEVTLSLDGSIELSVDGVVLELVGHVVGGGTSGVDGIEVALSIVSNDTGHKTANAAESVDSHAGGLEGSGGRGSRGGRGGESSSGS